VQIKEIVNFSRHVDTDNKILISSNAFKKSNFIGGQIFFLSDEFFRQTGRKVLPRVGNTARIANGCRQIFLQAYSQEKLAYALVSI
jgi:hypothetical protein